MGPPGRPLRPHQASQQKRGTGSPALSSAQKGDARCVGGRGRGGWRRTGPHLHHDSSQREQRGGPERRRVTGDPRAERVPFPQGARREVTPRTGIPPPAGPRHPGTPAGPPASQSLRAISAPPQGTWPWPPAPHPAPPPQPPRFRPKRGKPPDSRWTFPGAAALPGVQMGGCCPAPGRGRVEEAGLRPPPPPRVGEGWAQQSCSLACLCRGEGTGWQLSLQPGSPHPVTHISLQGGARSLHPAEAVPSPTPQGLGGSQQLSGGDSSRACKMQCLGLWGLSPPRGSGLTGPSMRALAGCCFGATSFLPLGPYLPTWPPTAAETRSFCVAFHF